MITLDEIVIEPNSTFDKIIKTEINNHLESLKISFDGYFSIRNIKDSDTWIVNPFAFKIETMGDRNEDEDNLI